MKKYVWIQFVLVVFMGCTSHEPEEVVVYPDVPYWVRGLSPAQYDFVRSCILGSDHDFRFDEKDGVLHFDLPKADSATFELGMADILGELAQDFSETDLGDWCYRLDEYMERQMAAAASMSKFEEQKKDFNAIKDRLQVRLYATTTVTGYTSDFVLQSPIPHVASVLVVVLPPEEVMVGVSQEDLKNWGVETGELFDIAYENTRKLTQVVRVDSTYHLVPIDDHPNTHAYCASTVIKFLEERNMNALVATPSNWKAIVALVENIPSEDEMIDFFEYALSEAEKITEGNVVYHIYSWDNEKQTLTPLTVREGGYIKFSPPDSALNSSTQLSLRSASQSLQYGS